MKEANTVPCGSVDVAAIVVAVEDAASEPSKVGVQEKTKIYMLPSKHDCTMPRSQTRELDVKTAIPSLRDAEEAPPLEP